MPHATRMRAMVTLAAAVVAGWLASLPARSSAADAPYVVIRDVVYASDESGPLRADIYQPVGEGPFPAVLCIHGGAWFSGDKSFAAAIAQTVVGQNYVAVAVNYRLAPRHKFPTQIEDCRKALDWVRKHAAGYKIDPERLAAWGYSAGGHLAALLGTDGGRLRAVVVGGAPCDFRNVPPDSPRLAFWLGGTRGEFPAAYEAASPAAFVSPDDPPMFFYHGGRDPLVDVSESTAMQRLLKGSRVAVQVYVLPEAGHVRAFLDRAARREAARFLSRHL